MNELQEDSVRLVMAYIEASQHAREIGDPADFELLRSYLADDVILKQASPWTHEAWRVIHEGPDAIISRLRQPSNASRALQTQTVNAVSAGDEVLVEQLSTIITDSGQYVSSTCFVFSIANGKITGGRLYRNDAGLPTA